MRSRLPDDVPNEPASDLLDEWVGAGLVAPDQADRIRAHEAARHERRRLVHPPAPAGPSLVGEALGYLGGVIMLVGAGILVGLVWEDLPVVMRLTLAGVTALTLVAAGFAVPTRLEDAAGRLRSFLWALAVAATAAFAAVWATDVLDRYDEDMLLVVFPPAALVAAALWWMRRTWLQQLALLLPLAVSAAAVGVQVSDADAATGLSVWLFAVAWTVVAWSGRLQPRATGVAFGGLLAVFGAATTASDLGIALGLLTAATLVALALYERSLPLLAVGAFGLLVAAPRAVVQWFPGRLAAPLTLIVVGGLLVGAAVWVARHQHPSTSPTD